MSIYLDYNATTPLRPEVWEAMGQVEFGNGILRNPSSVHKAGIAAFRRMNQARAQFAEAINAQPEEIFFTGGGSEAINLALKGAFWAEGNEKRGFVATAMEHHAVLKSLEWLTTQGANYTLVKPDIYCVIDPQVIAEAIQPDTLMVSVMWVNNEVGAIQPIAEIGAICRERGVLFHVDAVQALGKVPIDVVAANCDLLSCSAHKLGGPRGVGALYVRQGVTLAPLLHGGPQEKRLRGGTENLQGIVGFAEALRLALEEREENWAHWLELRKTLYRLRHEINVSRVNSAPDLTVPNCVNMSFMFCDGMSLTTNLSAKDIFVSTGSACSAGDLKPSHVLLAMGLSEKAAYSAIRFSMGRDTTAEDIEQTVETTKQVVRRLRLVTAPEDIGKCKEDCPCFLTG